MASHQEWEKAVIETHDLNKPFAPENGQPLKFKVGDSVTYTNDYGCAFQFCVTGLYQPKSTDSLYATGARYLLNKDSFWMPVSEASLTPIQSTTGSTK